MKKILYEQQVDWNWIKQRPQFLAEHLADRYEMHVFYRENFHRDGLQKNTAENGVVLHPFKTLPPFRDRFKALTAVNQVIRRRRFAKLYKQIQPDWVWLNYPSQIRDVGKECTAKIVYDCMDDHLELHCPPALRKDLPKLEKELCQRAQLVLASSTALKETLCRRYQLEPDKVQIVRNGCLPKRAEAAPLNPAANGEFRIGYIGTIAEWFDFPLILKSLEKFPNLEYGLAGPVCVENAPEHPRIHYYGTIPHEELGRWVQEFDCLAMPFQDMPLVRAVDPVKLYEYIGFNRSILCLDYPEVERFRPFASLYKGEEAYLKEVERLMETRKPPYTEEQARQFLEQNSWEARAEEIQRMLTSGKG